MAKLATMYSRAAVLLMFVGVALCGCASSKKNETLYLPEPPRTRERIELEEFVRSFATRIERAADEISDRETDAGLRRNAVFWKSRIIPSARAALDRAEDQASFMDLWLICVRQHLFLQHNPGFFGASDEVALQATQTLTDLLLDRRSMFLTDEQFDEAERTISLHAAWVESGNEDESDEQAGQWNLNMSKILGKPVSVVTRPLRSIDPSLGISDTAQAIHAVSTEASRYRTLIGYLPSELRWQLELLVIELEQSHAVESSLASLAEFSASSSQLARTVEEMPALVRAEVATLATDLESNKLLLSTLETAQALNETARELTATAERLPTTLREESSLLLAELNDSQSELQATLAGFDTAMASTSATIVEAEGLVTSAATTAASMTTMSAALTELVEAVDHFVRYVDPPRAEGAPPSTGKPFDINEYTRTAETLTETAQALDALVVQLDSSIRSGGGLSDLINQVLIGIGALLLFVTVLAYAYRRMTANLPRRSKSG